MRALTTDGLAARPRVMGVVNVTPDSFSDGGRFLEAERAIAHGAQLAAEGADLLDVGGESTRPGAEAVSAEVELERIGPVVEALARNDGPEIPVSIDTSKAPVARAALDLGAAIVNDVTALRGDPELAGLCADRGCEVVLMHMQGSPRTMQTDPRYDDVVDDVRAFLAERIEAAAAAGIGEDRIWVDPGIGFGKTVEHNLELLRRLGELSELGRPIVIGTSRKRFLGAITGREVGGRLGATIASNALALAAGADVFRVHEVAAARQALDAAAVILGREPWRRAGAR
jgi:dihydropteroate synthase